MKSLSEISGHPFLNTFNNNWRRLLFDTIRSKKSSHTRNLPYFMVQIPSTAQQKFAFMPYKVPGTTTFTNVHAFFAADGQVGAGVI